MTEELQHSSISINLREGSFTINGTENFVSNNLQNIQDFLTENLQNKCHISNKETSSPLLEDQVNSDIIENNSSDKYEQAGIYYLDRNDGTFQILKSVPGKSDAAKTRQIALIAAYARGGEVTNSEVIALCNMQSCYDGPNFSSIFKKTNGHFIRKGTGKIWSLKLTIPGTEAAEKLLESMMNVAK